MNENTILMLQLDVTLTEQEITQLRYLFTDAFGEFQTARNVEVQRAGTEDDAEYYANYGADLYVEERYPKWSEKMKKAKAAQVRMRCRLAEIIKYADLEGR
jgi:hypothetical protein